MDYQIFRTEVGKEFYVSRRLHLMGFETWCPVELRHFRTAANRRTKHRTVIERPAIPRAILASVGHLEDVLGAFIPHLSGVMTDSRGNPVNIPGWQVDRFRDYLEAHNAAERRRLEALKLKQKPKRWVKLDASSLPAILNELFGKQEEQAA